MFFFSRLDLNGNKLAKDIYLARKVRDSVYLIVQQGKSSSISCFNFFYNSAPKAFNLNV